MKDGLREIGIRIWKDIRAYWGFAALFLLYDMAAHWLFHAFCPLVIVTGLPCPGCGMTRAVFFFATGQVARGWHMNPLGILWLALTVYLCIMRYGFGRKAKGLLRMGGAIVALMVVLYLYRMWRYFPGKPPISYTPGNLLEHLVPEYRQWVFSVRVRL